MMLIGYREVLIQVYRILLSNPASSGKRHHERHTVLMLQYFIAGQYRTIQGLERNLLHIRIEFLHFLCDSLQCVGRIINI